MHFLCSSSSFSQGIINPDFSFSLPPATGPSCPFLKGILKVSLGGFLFHSDHSFPCVCVGRNGVILQFRLFPTDLDRRSGKPVGWTMRSWSPVTWQATPALLVIYSMKPSFSREILFRPPMKNWEALHKHWPAGFHGQRSLPWGHGAASRCCPLLEWEA